MTAHVLRLLATHHLLSERAPDVFANNRVSSYLDTGKQVGVPGDRYEGTSGVSAFVGLKSVFRNY